MKKEYQKRITRVIQYIEENLPNKISLAEVAQVSCFSPFHFHRIFSGITGETVNDYIARRRLERAVNLLVFKSELSITEVAIDSGYSSSANFSKAVKLHFGFSPSQIRSPSLIKKTEKIKDSKIGKVFSKYGKVFSKYGKDFSPSDLYPNGINSDVINNVNLEGDKMNVEVRSVEQKRVCSIQSERGYEPEAIFEAWDKLINWAENNAIKHEQQDRFALAFDNPTVTPIDKCRYTAAMVIGEGVTVGEPFNLFEIPKGKYAVLYFKGRPEETIQAQLSLYSNWLPNSGFEPDDFPMMERYLNDVRVDGYVELEIYVKLKTL